MCGADCTIHCIVFSVRDDESRCVAMWAMCGADCAVQCTVDDESRWLNITLQYITNYIVWSRLHGTVLWMMKADVSIFSNTVLYMIMFFVFLKYCTAHEHVFLYTVCFRYVVQYSARDDESRCLNTEMLQPHIVQCSVVLYKLMAELPLFRN